MDWFAARGFDTWTMDNEGYGRSDKHRADQFRYHQRRGRPRGRQPVHAEDERREKLLMYGISSGALRAGLFAQRHPERVARLALDAFVWTGEGSPTLAERKKKLAQWTSEQPKAGGPGFRAQHLPARPSGYGREATVNAFADAILSLDDSMPTGTYVDMCSRLPLVDPERSTWPPSSCVASTTASPASMTSSSSSSGCLNADKQFTVMAGISHASFQQKNYLTVYHILHSFFSQPQAVYRGLSS